MAIYHNRICRECGKTFSGGPRAWYCEDCRRERQREQARKYRMNPSKRKIGSEDICKNCGNTYIVNGSLQKYCPDCQLEMHQKLDNQQGIAYYKSHYDTSQKRAERSRRRREHYQVIKDEHNAKRREKRKQKKRPLQP